MVKRIGLSAVALVALLLVAATPARASSIAYTVTNTTGQPLGNPPFTLGSEFSLNANITVVGVGIFDDSLDGLLNSYQVGIWNSGGTLLDSGTVPSGTAGTLIGSFRYASIAPLNLLAGQNYWIGALYLNGNDPLIFPGSATGFTTDPAVTFVENGFRGGSSLSFPNQTLGTQPAYFGPDFEFNPTSPVPEPASITLLLLGSAVGLLRNRRVGRR
jgi:hypothetical protein